MMLDPTVYIEQPIHAYVYAMPLELLSKAQLNMSYCKTLVVSTTLVL